MGRGVRGLTAWLVVLGTVPSFVLGTAAPAAAGPPAVLTYYVPLTEADLRTAFDTLSTADFSSSDIHNVVGITVGNEGTIIYYDHREDGYETDIANPVQSTTEIWGDGDLGNGAAPGIAGDLFEPGDVVVLETDIDPDSPPTPGAPDTDAGDKVASSQLGVAMTRSAWPVNGGTPVPAHADAAAVYDLTRYGTSFTIPIGNDTASGGVMFEYTAAWVMASQDGTTVQIDADDDGSFEISQTIDEGERVFVNNGILEGADIVASAPVQVYLVTGDIGQNYETRWFEILPTSSWTTSYMTPVGTTSGADPVDVFLFNPSGSALTVTAEHLGGSDIVNVPANGSARYRMRPTTGTRLSAPGVFNALSTVDYDGLTFDWGFGLLPENILSTAITVGWAPGDLGANNSYNPVWVTAASPTTLQIDYDGDPSNGYDFSQAIAAFEMLQVRDLTDNDMTGARIVSAEGVPLAAAWGQDPVGSPSGSPAIDAGTTIFPLGNLEIAKSPVLVVDDGDSIAEPGEVVEWTIILTDTSPIDLSNVVLSDPMPVGATYVAGSTLVDGVPYPDDALPATPYPLDEGGLPIGTISSGFTASVVFRTTITPPVIGGRVLNLATATSDQATVAAAAAIPVLVPDLQIGKSADASVATPGQRLTYTIPVLNDGATVDTNLVVTDAIVPGSPDTTWVSTVVDTFSTVATSVVADDFQSDSYSGGTGWPGSPGGDWSEFGDPPNQETDGDIQIVDRGGGAFWLQLKDLDRGLTRTADLTGLPGNTNDIALLTFDYQRQSFDTIDDWVELQVRAGPGDPWDTLWRTPTPGQDAGTVTGPTFPISDYISPTFEVRFITSPTLGNGDVLYVDNFVIDLIDRQATTIPPDAFPGLATLPDLYPGETATITLEVDVSPTIDTGTITDISNTASVTSTNDPAGQSANVTIPLMPAADLHITKTAPPGPILAGSDAAFDILVENLGPNDATNVVVTDTLPADTTFVDTIPSGLCTGPVAGVLTCNLGSVAAAGSTSFQVVVNPDAAAAGSTITNTADVASDEVDLDPSNNSSSDGVAVDPAVDLSITKVDDVDPVLVGGTVIYTIRVDNAGPNDATDVTVADTFSGAPVTVVSITPSQGGCGAFPCNLGTIAAGGFATVDVEVTADDGGTITNDVSVTANETDTNPGNDAATETTAVNAVDLVLVKTAPATATAGGQLTYTLAVTNNGPLDSTGSTITDVLPAGVTFASSPDGCAPGVGPGTVECPIGPLTATSSVIVTFTVDVSGTAPAGIITNSASVTGNEPDGDPSSNTDAADVTVIRDISYDFDKTFLPPTVAAGASGQFTLRVETTGASTATNVSVADVLPAGLSAAAVDCDGGSDNSSLPGTIQCDYATLTPGTVVLITVDFDVAVGADAGTVTNTAVLSDDDGTSQSAPADLTITEDVALSAVKSFADAQVTAGGAASSFTVAVTNGGLSDADDVRIQDLVDGRLTVTGVTVTSGSGDCSASSGQSVDCTFATVAPGQTVEITVDFAVAAAVEAATIANSAGISDADGTVVPDATASVDVVEDVAYTVDKVFTDAVVDAGTSSTFTIAVTNIGLSDGDSLVITDIVDPNLSITGAAVTLGTGSCDITGLPTVTCTFASVPAGATVEVAIDFAVDPGVEPQFVSNTASVSDADGNSGSDTEQVEITEDVGLVATKVFSDPTVTAGGPDSSFTIAVTNNGASQADDVSVTDLVDASLTVTGVSIVAGAGTCNPVSQTVTCTFPSVDPGATVEVEVDFTVASDIEAQTVSNSASIADVDGNTATAGPSTVDIVEVVVIGATKAFAAPSVTAGGPGSSFTLTITNGGLSTADNVVLADAVDPALTVTDVTIVSGAGTCDPPSQTISCTFPSMGAGSTVQVRVDFGVDQSVDAQTVPNSVTATDDDGNSASGGPVTVDIVEDVSLSASKAFSTPTVTAGGFGQFTVTIDNSGLSSADNVTLTDTVDGRLTVTGAVVTTGTGTCSLAGLPVLSCTIPSLDGGGTAVVTVDFTVDPAVEPGTIPNSAGILDEDGNSATAGPATVDVVEDIDLSVTKVFTPSVANAGGPGQFVVTVTNAGASVADGVSVSDFVDAALIVGSVSSSAGGDCSASTFGTPAVVDCTIASLAPASSVTVTVDFTVDSMTEPGSIPNTVSVSDADGNVTSDTDSLDVAEDVGYAVTKVFTPPIVAAGTAGHSFTVDIENVGTSDAESITFSDLIAPQLTIVSAVGPDGPCDLSGLPTLTCSIASLAAGATATITVTYDVASDVEATSINNVVSVSDTDGNSGSGTGSLTIVEDVVLNVTKQFVPLSVVAGTAGRFTVLVENLGASDADLVDIADTVDPILAVTAVTPGPGAVCTDGDADPQTLECSAATIPAGGSVLITIDYAVDPAQPPILITNTTTAADADGNVGSSTATVTVVTSIVLDIEKLFAPSTVAAGQSGQFTITITNQGVSDSLLVDVSDTVDASLVVTGATASGAGLCTDGDSNPQTVTCSWPVIPGGGVETIVVDYDVDPATEPGPVTNTSFVSDGGGNTGTGTGSVELVEDIALAVTKAFLPATVDAGTGSHSMVLTVTNLGASEADNVTLDDIVDGRLTVTGAVISAGPGSCGDTDANPQTVECSTAAIAPGATMTVTVTFDVAESVDPATVSNSATAADEDGNTAVATAALLITESAELAATKTFLDDPVTDGGPYTVELSVTNPGPSDADNVALSDIVPAPLVVTSITVTAGTGSCDPVVDATVDCDFPTVAAGETVTVEVGFTVSDPTPSALVPNTLTVTSDELAGALMATDSLAIVNPAVSIDKSTATSIIYTGDSVTYDYVITNSGDTFLSSLVVVDDLGTPAPGDDVTVCVVSGPLAPGATAMCGFTTVLTADTTNVVTVTANPTDAAGGDHPALADVTASDAQFVDVINPSIAAVKTALAPIVYAGATATYQYDVTNTGDDPLAAVAVTDDSCAPVAFLGEFAGNGDGTLDPGEVWRFECAASLLADTTNTASASALDSLGQPAVSPAVQATVDVISPAIDIVKVADAMMVTPGTDITFTMAVTNTGDDPLTAVIVTDDTCAPVLFTGTDVGGDGVLSPLEIWTYDCVLVGATGDVTNVATATGLDSLTNPITDTDSVTVIVNEPPSIVDDVATTSEDTPVVIAVLDNDSDDSALDPSSVTVISAPSNGVATPNPDGTITYTPAPGFVGVDVFTYEACDDDGVCGTATVTVTVNGRPDAVDDSAGTNENVPVTIDVAGNDTDPEDDPLTVTAVGVPANGTVVVNPDDTVTYTPDPGFSGVDTFTYEICDAFGGCDTATVTVDVNDAPAAVDDFAVTPPDTPVLVPVLANDSDPDSLDPASVTIVTPPSSGSVTVNPGGTVTYVPDPGFTGVDTFVYEVCDTLGACATALVTIGVSGGGPIAVDDSASTLEDVPVTVPVLANDSHPQGAALAIVSATTPSEGGSVLIGVGTITYTPPAEFFGTVTFDYVVCEVDAGTGTPIQTPDTCATATVTIDIASVEDPPIIVSDPDPVIGPGDPIPPIVIVDPEGDPVDLSPITLPPGVTLNPDGTFTGTPPPGTWVIVVEACDSGGNCALITINLTVTALPITGIETTSLAGLGTALLAFGLVLVALTRRRGDVVIVMRGGTA